MFSIFSPVTYALGHLFENKHAAMEVESGYSLF